MNCRSIIAISTVVAACCAAPRPAHATGTLTYAGPGYYIDLEIGDDSAPAIASVTVAPAHKVGRNAVVLRRECTTVRFSPPRRVLVLRCAVERDGIQPFTLSVAGNRATLTIGRVVHHWRHFDWTM